MIKLICYNLTIILLVFFFEGKAQNKSINPKYTVIGMVTDQNNTIVPGVKVTFIEKYTGETKTFYTGKNGTYIYQLDKCKNNDKLEWAITYEKVNFKKGIHTDSIVLKTNTDFYINYKIEKNPFEININYRFNPIHFNLNNWDIRPDAVLELDKFAHFMNSNPNVEIELAAHTDCRGSKSDNLILSEKRAKATIQYLINHGIDKSRLSFKSFGESKLWNDCDCKTKKSCTEEGHQENNRVEFVIVKF